MSHLNVSQIPAYVASDTIVMTRVPLLRRLDFFGAAPSCAIGADLPRWEITVEDGPLCHTVFLREDGSGGQWQHLLDYLRQAG